MSDEKDIYEKLSEIQFQLLQTPLPKTGKNKHNGAEYYQLQDILPAVKIACKQHNCGTYTNFPFDTENMMYRAELHFRDFDSKEEIVFEIQYPELAQLNNGMNIAQSEGAYITYLRKYLYLNAFDLIERDIIDASKPSDDNTVAPIIVESKPPALVKVEERCKKDYPDEEMDDKLLNRVSMRMLKEKEITRNEKKEIYEYLSNKK